MPNRSRISGSCKRLLLLGESYSGRLDVVAHLAEDERSALSVLDLRNDRNVRKWLTTTPTSSFDIITLFRGACEGRYAAQYREGSNVIVREPDVAASFKTPQAVNDVLWEIVRTRRASGV